MKAIHRMGAIAAALAAIGAPVWAQSTTATQPNGTTMSTGPGVNSSLPGGANTAVGANSNQVQTTHLRAECFDTAANVWRTTGDCAPGARVGAATASGSILGSGPSTLSSPSTSPGSSNSAGTTLSNPGPTDTTRR